MNIKQLIAKTEKQLESLKQADAELDRDLGAINID